VSARPAVRVTGLRKAFGDKVVLDGIDLEIAEGACSPCSDPTEPAGRPRMRGHVDT